MLNDNQKDILRQNVSSSLLKYDILEVIKILDQYPSLLLDANYKIEYFFNYFLLTSEIRIINLYFQNMVSHCCILLHTLIFWRPLSIFQKEKMYH